MFVLTLNKKTTAKIFTGAAAFALALAIGTGVTGFFSRNEETSAPAQAVKLTATQEMVDYIREKGYTADIQSATVREVKIPKKFDAEFENFNSKIMRTDGLSLEKYKNDKVNKWTFELTDYGVEGKTATAVLLVKKDKLIGAYLLEMPDGIAKPLAKSAGQGDVLQ